MNDIELDARLTRHGERWREQNTAPPVIDWDRIVTPRPQRRWVAAAGVAALVAAVVVAVIAGTTGSHRGGAEAGRSAVALSPMTPADARYGSPARYFGLSRGGIYSRTTSSSGLIRMHPFATAIGGTQAGTTVYSTRPAPSCRTRLDATSYTTNDLLHGRGIAIDGQPQPVATIAGQPTATALAVSVSSGELAMAVTMPSERHRHGSPSCGGVQQIVFVNLRNGAVIDRLPVANPQLQVDTLSWSIDGQELAFRLSPTTADTARLHPATVAASGTHVLDIHTVPAPGDLATTPKILPLGPAPGAIHYGPVFWWRGGYAVTFNGSLYRIDEQGMLGAILASNFPDRVDLVSSDVTGEHLLVGSGELSYRWDFGQLTPLPGRFAEPTW